MKKVIRGRSVALAALLTVGLGLLSTTAGAGPALAAQARGNAVAPTLVPEHAGLTGAVPNGTVSPLFTHLTTFEGLTGDVLEWSHCGPSQCWVTDVDWGFDYNPGDHHLAGYGLIVSSSTLTHVQAEPLNLGDRNQVLESRTANSQTGFLEIDTPAIPQCHPAGFYLSNLHLSIRWPDGVVYPGLQTNQLGAAASLICT